MCISLSTSISLSPYWTIDGWASIQIRLCSEADSVTSKDRTGSRFILFEYLFYLFHYLLHVQTTILILRISDVTTIVQPVGVITVD